MMQNPLLVELDRWTEVARQGNFHLRSPQAEYKLALNSPAYWMALGNAKLTPFLRRSPLSADDREMVRDVVDALLGLVREAARAGAMNNLPSGMLEQAHLLTSRPGD